MSRWLNRFQPWGVLLLRLVLGVAMFANGWHKVIPADGFHNGNTMATLNHFAQGIAKHGMPYWLGYVSAFTEFAGGIFLILGLFTRFFAFLVTINMLVAIGLVTIHEGYDDSAYAIALAAIALMLLLAGPGKAALDRKIGFS